MKSKMEILVCKKCGRIIENLYGDVENIQIKCCNENMELLVPNSADASKEKHLPVYNVSGDEIIVNVPHVMEKEHYISWIALVSENKKIMISLYPEQDNTVHFPYIKGATIYSYCNKHGLWSTDVE